MPSLVKLSSLGGAAVQAKLGKSELTWLTLVSYDPLNLGTRLELEINSTLVDEVSVWVYRWLD